MNIANSTFEPKFDLGPFITIVGFAFTQLIMLIGLVWWISGWKAEVDLKIARNTADIEQQQSGSEARRAMLMPRIDAIERANGIEDERIGNMTDANLRRDKVTDELRTAVTDLTRNVAILTERLPPKQH